MANTSTPVQSTYQQDRVPFYGDIDSRDGLNLTKDQIFVNVFCESRVNNVTGERTMMLRKRPGMTEIWTQTVRQIRGSHSEAGRMFYAYGESIMELVNDVPTFRFNISNGSGEVGFAVLPFNGDDQTYLIVCDGTSVWQYNLGTNTYTGLMVAGYPTPHIPQPVVIDGYLLLAKSGTGDIYSSQLEDLAVWDFIEAELYSDVLVGLSRYNNYIAAMGSESVEFFFDAAIEDGSPFARNDSFVCPIGCAAPWATVAVDQRLIWVGSTKEGGKSIWMMTDTKPTEISNNIIKEALDTETFGLAGARAYTVRVQGHHFYVLNLSATTWVYDLKERMWHRWTTGIGYGIPRYIVDPGGGYVRMINPDKIYFFNPFYYTDSNNQNPIVCRWQTDMLDFKSMNRKFGHRLTIIGDTTGTTEDNMTVEWTDDDYNTFKPGRPLNLNAQRPAIVNLGYFRRRAWRFTYSNPRPLQLYAFELTYNIGGN